MSNLEKESILGNIPSDWEAVKLEEIIKLKSGDGLSKSNLIEGNYPVYGGNGVTFYHGKFNYSESKLIIGRVGAKCGCIHRTEKYSWITDNALIIDKSLREHNSVFLEYILNKVDLNQYANKNAQPVISGGKIYPLTIPFPPLLEQQKIAEILSTVDAKIEVIDQQITETQALKKGLMQRLLTKGIGHTEFKDSPVGEIPKSWEVVELSDIAKCTVGIATSTTHAYCENGVLLLRNQNIKEGKIALNDVLYITAEFDELNKSKRLKEDDIITVRTGYPGISAVVPKELAGSQSFTTLIIRRKSENILSKFLCYYINSEKGKSFFQSNQAGGGQQNVGSKTLESMKIVVPTLSEQNQIVNILTSVDEKLEVLSEKKTHYQELKQGLMQQLLTGKIRVNGNID
jgi:restriction endonuclease S subunit